MAVTITTVRRSRAGNLRRVIADVVGPTSYTTGGETLTVAQERYLFPEIDANLGTVDFTHCVYFRSETAVATTPAFLSCALDKVNNKMAFQASGAEATSTTNLSAQTVRCEFTYQFGSG